MCPLKPYHLNVERPHYCTQLFMKFILKPYVEYSSKNQHFLLWYSPLKTVIYKNIPFILTSYYFYHVVVHLLHSC